MKEALVELASLALNLRSLLEDDSQESPTERTLRQLKCGRYLLDMKRIVDKLTT